MRGNKPWLLMTAGSVGLCFVVGLVLGNARSGSSTSHPTSNPRMEQKLTAIVQSDRRSSSTASALARSKEFGFLEKFRGYLRLINLAEAGDIAGLFEVLERELIEDLGRESMLAILAKRWATIDPDAALEALISGEPRGIREFEEQVLAGVEPQMAWARLIDEGSISDTRDHGRLLTALIARISREDPDLAVQLITSSEFPRRFNGVSLSGLDTLAESSPETLLDHLDQAPVTSEGRIRLVEEAFRQLASSDSAAALARLDGLDGRERKRALPALASGWAAQDPEAAIEWASSLEGRWRDQAMREAILIQASTDSEAAASSLQRVTSPRVRASIKTMLERRNQTFQRGG